MTSWQDIATAPRDGTCALFYAPAVNDCAQRWRVDWWWNKYRAWANMRPSQPYTHWMPLPAPPQAQVVGE